MRYRKLDAAGDYVFGHSAADFYIDHRETVAQLIQTRLLLWQGEWFLDKSDGTPWGTQVLGKNTAPFYDQAIKSRILATPGVIALTNYSSVLDRAKRVLSVSAAVKTQYGALPLNQSITLPA